MPTLTQLVLLFFLGGAFVHFMIAGGRTFQYRASAGDEAASLIAQCSFLLGGTATIWLLGLYRPIHLPNGIVAISLLVLSVALYEWARHTIWGRRFGIVWGEDIPEAVCDAGPYRFVRHPLYLSYLLAFLAAAIAIPHWLTAAVFAANTGLLVHGALDDEQKLAGSALAADYAAYRRRVGMFFPRLRQRGLSAGAGGAGDAS